MTTTRFRNIIVLGDSLSDIGIMADSLMGRLAKTFGAMTVSPTGRYSDCRNWTDHMFETATDGDSLVMGNAAISKQATKKHQSLGSQSVWGDEDSGLWFRYANYAIGGATGDVPHSIHHKFALKTMEDQVKSFKKDISSMGDIRHVEDYLFIVWFGANDLYTAGLPANKMSNVAETIANKRRNELASLIGAGKARFIFINTALPLSAARYQEIIDNAKSDYQTAPDNKKAKKNLYNARMKINNFESGAILFNRVLREVAESNGDVYLDIASVLKPEIVSTLFERLNLIEGVQISGTSDTFVDGSNYDSIIGPIGKSSTSDKVHPTDRVYRLIWEKVRETLWENGYTFGTLPINKA